MDATVLAAIIIGVLAPFAQELITRGRFTGRWAIFVSTVVTPFAGGAIALWLTGGFALIELPAFSWADPSPLVGLLWEQAAKIAMISRLTYAIPGVGAEAPVVTEGPRGGLSVEAAGRPGLVQKVAGTTSPPPAPTGPTA